MAMPRADIALVAAPVEGLGLLVYDHARALDAYARGIAHAPVAPLAGLDGRHASPRCHTPPRGTGCGTGSGSKWAKNGKSGESWKEARGRKCRRDRYLAKNQRLTGATDSAWRR